MRKAFIGARFAQETEARDQRPQPGGQERQPARCAQPGHGLRLGVTVNSMIELDGDENEPTHHHGKSGEGQKELSDPGQAPSGQERAQPGSGQLID